MPATRVDAAPALQQALAQLQAGQAAVAEALCRRVLAQQPRHAQAAALLAMALVPQGRLGEALGCLDQAIESAPEQAALHNNRGAVLALLGRHEEALRSYDAARALAPAAADAWYNRGTALAALQRFDEAVASYDEAIRRQPDYAKAHNNRGTALAALERHAEALDSYGRALAVQPRYPEVRHNRAKLLLEQRQPAQALAELEALLAQPPGRPFALGQAFYCAQALARWDRAAHWRHQALQGLAQGRPTLDPLVAQLASGDPAVSWHSARASVAALVAPAATAAAPAQAGDCFGGARIRLAYLSADFWAHPVMLSLVEVFELHDRGRFELFAYRYGSRRDELTPRLERAFDHVLDVSDWSDERIAADLRARGIAIAVDLMGHTEGGRLGIFARRAAPVQVNHIGFPGTSGAAFLDYLVADPVLVPPAAERFYSEQVLRLPDCYLPCDRQRQPAATPTRHELGLPDEGFVFCSFSRTVKLTPELFAVWMRLLHAVPGSVLWLSAGNAEACANLQRAAQGHGVAPERLVFLRPLDYARYLACYPLADLFLDTAPYSALATAADALWMGLPVLTCTGQTYVGRGASSIVRAAGLPELATPSMAAYEALARRLATEPGALAALRARLVQGRARCALFDTPRYVRHLEAAYEHMFQRARQGLPPQGTQIPPLPATA